MMPIEIFTQWCDEEFKRTKVRIPAACCLSTNGLDGYPNARFVSLKEIVDNNFIITGSLSSRKGLEIAESEKVALTFWWTETERQIRVQGNATKIPESLASNYFAERNRDSRIVSIVSQQGKTLEPGTNLVEKYELAAQKEPDETARKPAHWGGYAIQPIRIEFMEFKVTRFHSRKLFEFADGNWTATLLQP